MKYYKLAEKIINEEDIAKMIEWLATMPFLTKGKLTVEFEKKWAQWVGTKYSVFCNSGSSANLLMAYASLISGRLKNKKVIVPSVGWVTTIAPFIQFGFDPIMCGADKDNFGMDLDELESLCQKHNPGAVIYVQVLGVPGNMEISLWKTLAPRLERNMEEKRWAHRATCPLFHFSSDTSSPLLKAEW